MDLTGRCARWACLLGATTVAAACTTSVSVPPRSPTAAVSIVDVAEGWANNSVNATVFRKNSLVSHGDAQFIAFYDKERYLVLGKRTLGATNWSIRRTQYQGNADDAHNSISIMVDGAGYLHVAWDHHNNSLRYARSIGPGALDLTEKMPMVGRDEGMVSYPEFYRQPSGSLLFFYRNGGSGHGDLVVNRYDVAKAAWTRLHDKLISGEGQRNAYWQAYVDHKGTLHVSWVWRESPDVASNHDMGYARSRDGGLHWETSGGKPYRLPITAGSAEYAARIPQNSELINQTSMSADKDGNPYIASYWREAGSKVPQYSVLYHRGNSWSRLRLDFRSTPFSLDGQGTKAIPMSRPQILVDAQADTPSGLLVFRDLGRGSRVSVVRIEDFSTARWSLHDLTSDAAGAWEPSFDTELWRRQGELHLFLQNVQQVDAEGHAMAAPSMVRVLQWKRPAAAPAKGKGI